MNRAIGNYSVACAGLQLRGGKRCLGYERFVLLVNDSSFNGAIRAVTIRVFLGAKERWQVYWRA